MPPTKNKVITYLNFKKALDKSLAFVSLRIHMRDTYRKQFEKMIRQNKIDHNVELDVH